MLSALVGGILGLLERSLHLLNLALQELVPVVEGCDFLLLGQILLLHRSNLGLELLGLLLGVFGLQTEGVHSLDTAICQHPVFIVYNYPGVNFGSILTSLSKSALSTMKCREMVQEGSCACASGLLTATPPSRGECSDSPP